jgi:hypothetical protein
MSDLEAHIETIAEIHPPVRAASNEHHDGGSPDSEMDCEMFLRNLVLEQECYISPEEIKLGPIKGLGSFADVYVGTLRDAKTSLRRHVAVKRFRVIRGKEKEFSKVLDRT